MDAPLVIEVAETSLIADRDIKVPFYACSGIPESWIVSLVDRVVEVYRQPGSGVYWEVPRGGADDVLDVLMVPGTVYPPPAPAPSARR